MQEYSKFVNFTSLEWRPNASQCFHSDNFHHPTQKRTKKAPEDPDKVYLFSYTLYMKVLNVRSMLHFFLKWQIKIARNKIIQVKRISTFPKYLQVHNYMFHQIFRVMDHTMNCSLRITNTSMIHKVIGRIIEKLEYHTILPQKPVSHIGKSSQAKMRTQSQIKSKTDPPQ